MSVIDPLGFGFLVFVGVSCIGEDGPDDFTQAPWDFVGGAESNR